MYPLEWFDSLVITTFNPNISSINSISDFDSKVLCDNINSESQRIKAQIKVEIFEMKSKRQIRLLVRKYHSSFVFLLDSIVESRKNEVFFTLEFLKISDVIITSLNDLLSFVEIRFSRFYQSRSKSTNYISYRMENRISNEFGSITQKKKIG